MNLDLIRQLRIAGVKAARLGISGTEVLEVEFFPMEAPAPVDVAPLIPKSFGKPETCRCGHEVYEHAGDGFCLRGCAMDMCIQPPPAETEKRP